MVYTLFPETLKLMKEDLIEIIGTSQPDKPASCVTDEEFALAQWKKEVDDAEAAFRDRQLAVRVALLPEMTPLPSRPFCRKKRERGLIDR
ncbi:hypothetical protein N7533_005145 [Penicillium manginii]|uniref:uncharacterized protein n=1 Tax=Penicillium manginii TaxID=203109 RepID=UPI002549B362|nr:uncharacterized protein N7533_005145 [Penicillium manginii]KAJ5755602.1 hypothetical protein N7533_005145 [Penicillium manginii]